MSWINALRTYRNPLTSVDKIKLSLMTVGSLLTLGTLVWWLV